MLYKIKYIIIFIILISTRINAQDPHFSQFYANSLYLAPSFAGSTEDNRLILNYRNQWPGIDNVYSTYSVSYDHYFPNFRSGLGILATYDVAGSGDLSNTNIGLIYSYDIQINQEWHIRPGVNFKFVHNGLNYGKLIWNSMITPNSATPVLYPPGFESVSDIDFAASVLAFNDRMWGGVTVDHLFRPTYSFYGDWSDGVPVKVNVFGGAQISRRGRLIQEYKEIVYVAGNVKYQDGAWQSDLGFYYYRNPLMFGVWYRGIPFLTSQAGDAIVLLVGYKTDKFHIGYSYDFTISNLIGNSGGAHEVSLVWNFSTFNINSRARMFHALPCPDF